MRSSRILSSMLLVLPFILNSCGEIFGPPETVVMNSVSNWSSTKKAVMLEYDGNATVNSSLQISVFDQNYQLKGSEIGNVFTVDDGHGAAPLDTTSLRMYWMGNDTLQIVYNGRLRVFRQEKVVDGIVIIYKSN